MAFILDDQDPSITSESAPFIQPVDYDSDIELFQVPLKRSNSPIKIPSQDPIPKAALQYALKPSSPPAPSEDSLSINTHSQPNLTSRDTSPHNKSGSSPPSSVYSEEHEHEAKHHKHKHSNASNQKNKILHATQLHLTKGKAKTVLTKRPKKLILPLKANIYQAESADIDTEDEEDFSRIHQWLEKCHVSRTNPTHANSHHQENQEVHSKNGCAILAGPHLLHPFLGSALFSPPMAEPKVHAINIHGTLAHHTLTNPEHNGEIKMQSVLEEGLVAQEMSDRNSSHQATSDSAYDRAREMEIWLSEHISVSQPHVLLKGKAHWFIDANLTEESHLRLAGVARQSAEGFECLKRHHLEAAGGYHIAGDANDLVRPNGVRESEAAGGYTWGPGGTFTADRTYVQGDRYATRRRHKHGQAREREEQHRRMVESQTAAELAELYRALAVVHTVFGEEMKAERERMGQDGSAEVSAAMDGEKERGRGRHRERYGGARERGREQEYRDETGVVRRRSMGSKIGSLRGRRRRRVGS